eukprot:GHRR01002702.1.p1 GENE.GHRR01002702.1~~GHRR01002702.1.p1  ORF type:complete len:215 (+),score=53.00 GHRR01002702.1:536-1180(+)
MQCALQQHSLARSVAAPHRTGCKGRSVGLQHRLAAVQRDADISTRDWRTQTMAETVHKLFDRVWSKGDLQLLNEIVTEDFVWKDTIWMPSRPIVGKANFRNFVQQMRQAYPDLHYDIGQVGVCDPVHVFVHWDCHGTNLYPTTDNAGRPHKPTFHESHISGIDFITFNIDRSKLQEIIIYRQPTLEERQFLEEEALEQDRLAIKLERLHFDGRT